MKRAEVRLQLDELGIEYPKSGKGSGRDALLELLPKLAFSDKFLRETMAAEGLLQVLEEYWWVLEGVDHLVGLDPNTLVRPGHKAPGKPMHGGKWVKRRADELPRRLRAVVQRR